MSITQDSFAHLMSLDKSFEDMSDISLDGRWAKEIISNESKDVFILHYTVGRLCLDKFSYNKNYRKSIPLLRFCSSKRHTNPDGTVFEGAHVHVYREGFGDKVAFPIEEIGLTDIDLSKGTVLESFLDYCNVTRRPRIINQLF